MGSRLNNSCKKQNIVKYALHKVVFRITITLVRSENIVVANIHVAMVAQFVSHLFVPY